MKTLLPLLILCATYSMTVNAQSTRHPGGVKMTQGLDPLYAQIEITKDVVEQRYCSDDSLQFVLRLNFSNKGKEPVILDKTSRSGSGLLVSRTFENAVKKKYEFIVERLAGYDPVNAVPDESNFIVLQRGESYPLEQVVRLYDLRSVRPGHHVLQMVVQNWPYFASSNIEWRNRWRNRGYLWTDPITSVPMPFTIARKSTIVECR